jgi:hypothetical protein
MTALVLLIGSGDAYMLVNWNGRVEGRYFPHGDTQFRAWLRWHQSRHHTIDWSYVGPDDFERERIAAGINWADFTDRAQNRYRR